MGDGRIISDLWAVVVLASCESTVRVYLQLKDQMVRYVGGGWGDIGCSNKVAQ